MGIYPIAWPFGIMAQPQNKLSYSGETKAQTPKQLIYNLTLRQQSKCKNTDKNYKRE